MCSNVCACESLGKNGWKGIDGYPDSDIVLQPKASDAHYFVLPEGRLQKQVRKLFQNICMIPWEEIIFFTPIHGYSNLILQGVKWKFLVVPVVQ